jgi:hypothetical protein
MIVAIHGVPGLSFAETTYMLSDLGLAFVGVMEGKKPHISGNLDKRHVTPVVFDSAKSFVAHNHRISLRYVAFVCDSYQRLHVDLGWPVVGVVPKNRNNRIPEFVQFDRKEMGLLLQADDRLREPVQFVTTVTKKASPSDELISKFGVSALSQAQTIVYKIKDQDVRSRTFLVVRRWFMSELSGAEKLRAKLQSLAISRKHAEEMCDVLLSEPGMKLRRAVSIVKKNPDKITLAAKEARVSAFDIRYLMSKSAR